MFGAGQPGNREHGLGGIDRERAQTRALAADEKDCFAHPPTLPHRQRAKAARRGPYPRAMGSLSSIRVAASTRHRSAPFLTDATAGLRTEFSGVVFEQWVAKTANWLEDEFDTGVRLHLNMRAHWLWPVVVAALDEVEGCLAPIDDCDAVMTLGALPDALVPVIAVHEHPMAMPFREPLPARHLDFFLLVRGGGDYRPAGPRHDHALLTTDGQELTASELLELAPALPDGARIACVVDAGAIIQTPEQIAALCVAPWRAGASLVITDGSSDIHGERCTTQLRIDASDR